MNFMIKNNQKILFIGDSITDCGRRDTFAPAGNGYVKLFMDMVTANFPERRINFVNKGIGGNTIIDLKQRWEDDVIHNKPDWLSILIGINDIHRVFAKVDMWENFACKKYRENYERLLETTKKRLSCRIILLEPFYITVDSTDWWRGMVKERLAEYREVVSGLSKKHNTLMIKTQDLFNKHLKYRDGETFCAEPVHPNQAGHMVIANALFNLLKR